MTFEAIFLTVFISAWVACGSIGWLVFSVATRGHAGLVLLPVCMVTGLIGGISVPLLFRDDAWGILVSLVVAVAASLVLLAAHRFSLGAIGERAAVPTTPKERSE